MASLCYHNFCTKTDTGDKIKYSRIPKNTETQQDNTKDNTKKRPMKQTGIDQKRFPD